MKSQKALWQAEHTVHKTFTRIHSNVPSGPVVELADFLTKHDYVPTQTKILDIGCGNGRNSIYLAKLGFQIIAIDFIDSVLTGLHKKAKVLKLSNIETATVDLAEPWPYLDQCFNVCLDCNTTICLPNPGREQAIQEASRVLKPGGYYLFYGVAFSDLTHLFPGPEPNSGIFPDSGKFEKEYTKEELLAAYGKFKLVDLKKKKGEDVIEGRPLQYELWVALFQK